MLHLQEFFNIYLQYAYNKQYLFDLLHFSTLLLCYAAVAEHTAWAHTPEITLVFEHFTLEIGACPSRALQSSVQAGYRAVSVHEVPAEECLPLDVLMPWSGEDRFVASGLWISTSSGFAILFVCQRCGHCLEETLWRHWKSGRLGLCSRL